MKAWGFWVVEVCRICCKKTWVSRAAEKRREVLGSGFVLNGAGCRIKPRSLHPKSGMTTIKLLRAPGLAQNVERRPANVTLPAY